MLEKFFFNSLLTFLSVFMGGLVSYLVYWTFEKSKWSNFKVVSFIILISILFFILILLILAFVITLLGEFSI